MPDTATDCPVLARCKERILDGLSIFEKYNLDAENRIDQASAAALFCTHWLLSFRQPVTDPDNTIDGNPTDIEMCFRDGRKLIQPVGQWFIGVAASTAKSLGLTLAGVCADYGIRPTTKTLTGVALELCRKQWQELQANPEAGPVVGFELATGLSSLIIQENLYANRLYRDYLSKRKGPEAAGQSDKKSDTEKKPKKNSLPFNDAARAIARKLKTAKRAGDKYTKEQAVSDYLDENPECEYCHSYLLKVLAAHPDKWKHVG